MSIALDHHTPRTFVDPHAADPADTAWPPAAGQDTTCLLPPPNPAERLSIPITPRDQRRVGLHREQHPVDGPVEVVHGALGMRV